MGRVLSLVAAMLVLSAAPLAGAEPPPAPVPIGPGVRYHPRPYGRRVAERKPVHNLACSHFAGERRGVHLELFGRGLVVIVPAGIGVAPPLRTAGAFILSGRCSYSARTRDPTGVIEISSSANLTLGDFFALWGQPLSARRLAGFRAVGAESVHAWVGGRPWSGDPRDIPLRRHAEIVLELGRFVPPHAIYRFKNGL